MPRTPKKDNPEVELDQEAVEAAVQEAKEDLRAEEAAAAFFAAEKSGAGEEEGDSPEAEGDEGSAEPILGVPVEADSLPAEAEDDAGSAGQEPSGPEVQEEEEVPEPVTPAYYPTAAERRPTTMGGTTVWTQD